MGEGRLPITYDPYPFPHEFDQSTFDSKKQGQASAIILTNGMDSSTIEYLYRV